MAHRSMVIVGDPKIMPQKEYHSVINLLNKPWGGFIKEHPEPFKETLAIKTDFPVRT